MDTQVSKWIPRDAGYYLKGGSSLFLNEITGMALGLLTTYLFTNYTSKETYGNFGYLLSVLGVASLTALPGVNTAIMYSTAKGYSGALRYGTWLRLRTVWLGVVGMLVVAVGLALANRTSTASYVAIGAVLLPLIHGFTGFSAFLQGQARFGEYAVVNLLIEVGKVVTMLLAVFILHLDGVPLVGTFFLAIAFLTTATCLPYIALSRGERGPQFDTMGRTLTGAAVLATLAQQADRLIVGTFLGMGSMAAYNLGFTLTDPLRNFGKLVARLLFPKIVHMDALAPLFLKKYALALALLAATLGLLVIVYWVGFPIIQPIFFKEYSETVNIVRWLIVATALAILDIVAIQTLWGLHDLRPLYATQFIFPMLRIAMLGIGAWLFGVKGILGSQLIYHSLVAMTIAGILVSALARQQRQPKTEDCNG